MPQENDAAKKAELIKAVNESVGVIEKFYGLYQVFGEGGVRSADIPGVPAHAQKYIYDSLRALDRSERGSGAFNWFESTGLSGDIVNLLRYKLRIWKFTPLQYNVDRGWQNDHLDNQGRYQGPDVFQRPTVPPGTDETF